MFRESQVKRSWLSCWISWRMSIKQREKIDMNEIHAKLMEYLDNLSWADCYKVMVYARVLVKIEAEKKAAEV